MRGNKIYNYFFAALSFNVLFVANILGQDYTVNGFAYQENCNCYTLTEAQGTQYGSVWNVHKISLENSFDFNFKVFLGEDDLWGADGIAFVLQPISTSVGTGGGGLGFQGVVPSIGVTLDTYENETFNDPVEDHIAIQANGDSDHNSANNLAGPVPISATSNDVEDGQFHDLRVVWDATTHTLEAYFDGVFRVSSSVDLVTDIFGGDPMVYWGFTGSTGGAYNWQRFCTQNVAQFSIENPSPVYCDSATIQFQDQSLSSSEVSDWYWDFGDGTTSTEQNPSHHYGTAGTYDATLYVKGYDGCLSDTFSFQVAINPSPEVDFVVDDICFGNVSSFSNQTTISSGSVYAWQWDFGVTPEAVSSVKDPTYFYDAEGEYTVNLVAVSDKGCVDSLSKTVKVSAQPNANFSIAEREGCSPFCIEVENSSTINSGSISTWYWDLGDGTTSADKIPTKCYSNTSNAPESYDITLVVVSDEGCSDTMVKPAYVTVYSQPIASFSADAFVLDVSDTKVNFTNTSSNATSYSWDFGDDSPTSNSLHATHDFPSHTHGEYEVVLTVSNQIGCSDTAMFMITVLAPDPVYEIPNVFTPNADGMNDLFELINPSDIGKVEIQIFNRWGNLVYESKDDDNFSWNGKANNSGGNCADGVYFYKLKVVAMNGKENNEHGYVHLVR